MHAAARGRINCGLMEPVRLGYVQYLNTLPLVTGLEAWGDVRLIPAVPSRLGDMLARGEADIALASLVDLATHAADVPLSLLPVGMIGCDGPTLTVRVYSRRPFEQADALHADGDSRTSVVLAQVVLAMRHGVRLRVSACDAGAELGRAAMGSPDAPDCLLVIGDKVIAAEQEHGGTLRATYPHQLDLGQAWRELTGLPFVYACWMCRAPDANSPAIVSAAALLDRQRRRNVMRLDWIVDRFAAERHWPAEVARHYVRDCLRYEVTPAARAGAERFLAEASRLGLIAPVTPLWVRVVDAPSSAATA